MYWLLFFGIKYFLMPFIRIKWYTIIFLLRKNVKTGGFWLEKSHLIDTYWGISADAIDKLTDTLDTHNIGAY